MSCMGLAESPRAPVMAQLDVRKDKTPKLLAAIGPALPIPLHQVRVDTFAPKSAPAPVASAPN